MSNAGEGGTAPSITDLSESARRQMPDYNSLAACYDQTRGGEERGTELAPWLSGLLTATGPILDIGVGTGLIAQALVARGRDVVGVDVSHEMLAVARERVACTLLHADASNLPFESGSFGNAIAVLLFQLINGEHGEHLPLLLEAARVLWGRGRLVITPVVPERPRDPIGAYEWDHGGQFRWGIDHLTSWAARASLRRVAVATGPSKIQVTSPNEAAARFEALWKLPADSAVGLRALPDPDVRVKRDLTQFALVLERL